MDMTSPKLNSIMSPSCDIIIVRARIRVTRTPLRVRTITPLDDVQQCGRAERQCLAGVQLDNFSEQVTFLGFSGLGTLAGPGDVSFDCFEPGWGGEAVDGGQVAKVEECG